MLHRIAVVPPGGRFQPCTKVPYSVVQHHLLGGLFTRKTKLTYETGINSQAEELEQYWVYYMKAFAEGSSLNTKRCKLTKLQDAALSPCLECFEGDTVHLMHQGENLT